MSPALHPLGFWLVAAAALLLWVLLVGAEWRRLGKKRALLRSLLLLGAIAALFLAWWQPSHSVKGAGTTLLINGEASQPLDSLLQVYPAARVLSLQPHPDHPMIEGVSYLPQYLPEGSPLFLLGEGLRPRELQYLKNFHLTYLPGKPLQGVLALSYSKLPGLGDSLTVTGRWQASSPDDRLQLSFGGLALDSVQASQQQGGQPFFLQAPLVVAGWQAFQLYWLDQRGDTLGVYPLPLQPAASPQLQLALLTAYPEAESKYLKEYLGQQGFKLHYVAQLGPGKLVQEWLNMPRNPLRFSAEGLKDFDILIMTTGYWAGLGRGRQQEIARQVEQRGLGLIFYPDAESNSLRWQGQNLQFAAESFTDTLHLSGTRLPLEYRRLEKGIAGWEKTTAGGRSAPALVRRRLGLGMLALSGGQQTYRLLLQGQTAAYSAYWHHLLGAVMPLPQSSTFLTQEGEASEREALRLRLHSSDSLPTLQIVTGSRQQPNPVIWQSPLWRGQWHVLLRPRTPGWYEAYAAEDSLMLQVQEQPTSLLKAAWREASLEHSSPAQPAGQTIYRQEPIPRGWFYVVFLISMGGLWLERKLLG